MNLKRNVYTVAAAAVLIAGLASMAAESHASSGQEVPKLQVDPAWPRMPNGWSWGQVSSAACDDHDNIWILQRPKSVRPDQKAGPPVMEFDKDGNYIKGWGGPGDGYDWPQIEHGIYVDYKGFVWIGGSGNNDQILKFTQDGKFVMQIGHSTQKKSNADTSQFWRPADVFVYPKTNELFVADGYGNKRVIVFDADTGQFKRMWGAFGKVAEDSPAPAAREGGPGGPPRPDPNRIPAKELPADDAGPAQFDTVHGIKVSNDGLVYVADRGGKRVQVFTTEGKYQAQIWIDRWCEAIGQACGNGQTTASVAFSADPEQRFLYVASRSPARIWVYDRKALKPLYYFGSPGVDPGQFYALHEMTTDFKGNLYATEVEDGKRIQKFVFKGMVTLPVTPSPTPIAVK
jgi:DNA-binding beta-propeller fold protein YncE